MARKINMSSSQTTKQRRRRCDPSPSPSNSQSQPRTMTTTTTTIVLSWVWKCLAILFFPAKLLFSALCYLFFGFFRSYNKVLNPETEAWTDPMTTIRNGLADDAMDRTRRPPQTSVSYGDLDLQYQYPNVTFGGEFQRGRLLRAGNGASELHPVTVRSLYGGYHGVSELHPVPVRSYGGDHGVPGTEGDIKEEIFDPRIEGEIQVPQEAAQIEESQVLNVVTEADKALTDIKLASSDSEADALYDIQP